MCRAYLTQKNKRNRYTESLRKRHCQNTVVDTQPGNSKETRPLRVTSSVDRKHLQLIDLSHVSIQLQGLDTNHYVARVEAVFSEVSSFFSVEQNSKCLPVPRLHGLCCFHVSCGVVLWKQLWKKLNEHSWLPMKKNKQKPTGPQLASSHQRLRDHPSGNTVNPVCKLWRVMQ